MKSVSNVGSCGRSTLSKNRLHKFMALPFFTNVSNRFGAANIALFIEEIVRGKLEVLSSYIVPELGAFACRYRHFTVSSLLFHILAIVSFPRDQSLQTLQALTLINLAACGSLLGCLEAAGLRAYKSHNRRGRNIDCQGLRVARRKGVSRR